MDPLHRAGGAGDGGVPSSPLRPPAGPAEKRISVSNPRLLALALIVFLLFQPSREEKVPVPAREKSIIFALDDSASMAEPHRTGSSRIDAARADLEAAGVLHDGGGRHRFVQFPNPPARPRPSR